MDSMIERVARAMWQNGSKLPWDHVSPNIKAEWRRQARAGINATREPTEAMIAAGVEARCEHGESQCGAAYSWQEMIDAALKEGE